MNRGTASVVQLGKNVTAGSFSGLNVLTNVILGKKEALQKDFNGLVLTDLVMLGKKISHITIITVTVGPAVSPLLLPDAIANSLSYVKAFGGTEQNGTPTPDTPMDIVSNNGVLKVRHQSGLPLGYTLLDYIETDGNSYIDTNLLLSNTDTFGITFQSARGTLQSVVMGATSGGTSYTSTNNLSVTYNATGGVNAYSVYCDGAAGNPNYSWNGGNCADKLKHTIKYNGLNIAPTIDGVAMTQLVAHTLTENNPTVTTWLFGRNNTSTGTLSQAGVRIYNVNIQGKGHFIPAKNASDVVGMYDLVSGQFFTNAGTGTFTAGPNAVDPITIVTDGTVEMINAHGKNLFDVNNPYKSGYAITQNGSETSVPSFSIYSLKVEPLTTYTYSCNYTESVTTRIHSYDKNGNWIQQDSYGNANATKTFTTTSNTAEIRISINNTAALSAQFELGSTATSYEPYYNGGTATAEMLLKVGDYTDEQEIISGVVTRKVGVKVLDGTENWNMVPTAYADGTHRIYTNDFGYDQNTNGISTHFVEAPLTDRDLPTGQQGKMYHSGTSFHLRATQFTSLEVAKQWLAAQYAAGTPVIVIYPLATETTESVTGQTLQVTQGDNVLEITQASIDGLELEAQYEQGVQASVQEIEP